jgi:hypothetical protein
MVAAPDICAVVAWDGLALKCHDDDEYSIGTIT